MQGNLVEMGETAELNCWVGTARVCGALEKGYLADFIAVS